MVRKIICFLLVSNWLIVVGGYGKSDEPINVSLSKVYNDPATYNHKLIKVSGVISQGFENFTMADPNCSNGCVVWLEYGGRLASGTVYCCGISAARQRAKPIVIDKIPIPLVQDKTFHKFDKLVQQKASVTVNATVIGRFFAGDKSENLEEGNVSWGGYGHFGCCSLLVIQQIVSLDQ